MTEYSSRLAWTSGVTKSFGGITALKDVSLIVGPGEVVGLIGPNGAGKTTLLNILSGFIHPDQGEIFISGRSVKNWGPEKIARAGVARTFQLSKVLPDLSVRDNLLLGAHVAKLEKRRALTVIREVMEKLGLAPLAHQPAERLSGGQARLLEFGACLISSPRLLLLDEPFAAIHPHFKDILIRFIREELSMGRTFLIVSHDLSALAELKPRIVFLNGGEVAADGSLDSILNNKALVETYLGALSNV
ncbi:MAG: ATP-binding cassette domain-containing protein [Deltaproteobacteria bacterium]|nr:ATP-binding cassette domain-containing protein [Deltaproteobacteria bacterium]